MNNLLTDAEINYETDNFPELRPFQADSHTKLREGFRAGHRRQVLMAPTGSGKCLGINTPILMYDGSIKMVQYIKKGDRLIGPDSKPRVVISTCHGLELLYKITPNKGDSYVVNKSHILSLKKTNPNDPLTLSNGVKVSKDADIVNVNVQVLLNSNKTANHQLKGWRASEITFKPNEDDCLLLEPYWLGAWLGDGTIRHASISKPYCKMVDYWERSAKKMGYVVTKSLQKKTDCPTWKIVGYRRDSDGKKYNIFNDALDCYGLREKKHIPDEYMRASVKDRLQLIAGLLDSDGIVTKGCYDWINKCEKLANDFAFLCRSVGLSAYVKRSIKGIKSIGFKSVCWRVSISGDTHKIPCLDKKALPRKQKKRDLVHGISIKDIGNGDYYGFEIDGDHLFLLGDFTVTHNTILAMKVIQQALQKGKRVMFVCDRTTLIDQTSAVADNLGLSAHGILQAQHWRTNRRHPFQIASIQTLARRQWPEVDLIVNDECHVNYKSFIDHVTSRDIPVIGLSATPFSKGLGKVYSNLVNATTISDLVDSGVLVPMRVFSCTEINMRGAETKMGEWTKESAEERGVEIIGDVTTDWKKFADNKKTIAFGATVAHCEQMQAEFIRAGVKAEVFSYHTQPEERIEILKEFSKPDSSIKVLISVEALAKGFDVKDIEAVIDARPLRKSLSCAMQMWGRGMRSSTETGKTECILLDFSGNIVRFYNDYIEIYFNGLSSLDDGEMLDKVVRESEERDEVRESTCPACGATPFIKKCICGYEIVPPIVEEALPGEMQEIMIGKNKAADNMEDLYNQVCSYSVTHSSPDKQEWRARFIFKDITGIFPPIGLHFSQHKPVKVSIAVKNKIRSKNIAYSKRRR